MSPCLVDSKHKVSLCHVLICFRFNSPVTRAHRNNVVDSSHRSNTQWRLQSVSLLCTTVIIWFEVGLQSRLDAVVLFVMLHLI